MEFRSDNVAGVAEEIMAAIAAANMDTASAYGDDEITQALDLAYSNLFETSVRVFPVLTGTVANALSASLLSPPWGAVLAEAESHIYQDECGAPEFFTGGAKIIPLLSRGGKIPPQELRHRLAIGGQGFVHASQPSAFSLTQSSESGAVYTPEEVAELAAIAKESGLGVHMDGARFANALAALNTENQSTSPADITWRAGVDVLSFGATKNGALGAEAVILFRTDLAEEMSFRRKRAGQLASKMRYISTQLAAYIEDGLWLRLADHANRLCGALAQGLGAISGVVINSYGGTNELFVELPGEMVIALRQEGFKFYDWPETIPAVAGRRCTIRLVTRHDMTKSEVEGLITAVKRLAV